MGNFFGFQGGNNSEGEAQTKKSSPFGKIGKVFQNVKMSTANISSMSNIELNQKGRELLGQGNGRKALDFFMEGARRYDTGCMMAMYEMYANGSGVEKDLTSAWFWARMSSDCGDGLASNITGICYRDGLGVDADREKAWAYFDRALKQGFDAAKQNFDEIRMEHIDKSMLVNSTGQQMNGRGLDNEKGAYTNGKPDYIAAHFWFENATITDFKKYAYWNLAKMYMLGLGVVRDNNIALDYFNRAAGEGHSEAKSRVMLISQRMSQSEDNLKEKAMSMVRISAANELESLMSEEMKIYYYMLAADKGDEYGTYMMGLAYYTADGLARDFNEALYYFGKSIFIEKIKGKESPYAYRFLAQMYTKGFGVRINLAKANELYDNIRKDAYFGKYTSAADYMEKQYATKSKENIYEDANSCINGDLGVLNFDWAIQKYEECLRRNYHLGGFKLINIFSRKWHNCEDYARVFNYMQRTVDVIGQEKMRKVEGNMFRSHIKGLMIYMYNEVYRERVDDITIQMIEDICRKYYSMGEYDKSKVCAQVACYLGHNEGVDWWNQLENNRKKQEEQQRAEEQQAAAEANKEKEMESEEDSGIGYSDSSDWTPYIFIENVINDLDIHEIRQISDCESKISPVNEGGRFDAAMEKIRNLVSEGDYYNLCVMGYEYREKAQDEDASETEKWKNFRIAATCFKISAENGDPDGLVMLSELFVNGMGVPFSPKHALDIHIRAEEYERERYADEYDKMYNHMSMCAQREEAEPEGYSRRQVENFDKMAYYMEKNHYEEEEWLINEFYARAHEKESGGRILPIKKCRNLYKGAVLDWNKLLGLDWENIFTEALETEVEEADDAEEVENLAVTELQKSSEDEMPENLDKYFEGMIGMEFVKNQLEKIYQSVKMQILRNKILEERGEEINASERGYNFILLGNPGTGKTTVARIIAQILYDIGIHKSNSFIEVERSGMVSDHIGGTEKRVREILEKADGGTLFIDEAYALYKEDSDNDFGQEAIDVLMKDMEDKRDAYSVIMAGYREPMLNMIKNANSGFSSRFSYTIELPDYEDDALVEIAYMHIKKQKFEACDNVDKAIVKCINHDKIDNTFGNARYIRELVNRAIENQSHRLTNQGNYSNEDLFMLRPEDFWQGEIEDESVEKYLKELNMLIGLESVKKEVESLVNLITVQKEMEKRGIENGAGYGTLHMAFKGNPGTGKTTVARIIGHIYASLGVLKRGDVFVECSRAELVGKFQGHTAANVKKVVDSAMGGILFVDEAYSLVQGENDSFGKEAVDTLVAEMENNRENLVVVFAGYTKDIDEFFKNNQGLRSRVPNDIVFEDYNLDELTKIAMLMLEGRKLKLTDEVQAALKESILANSQKEDFGNARGVRNVVEGIVRRQNVRIAKLLSEDASKVTDEMMLTVEEIDIEK